MNTKPVWIFEKTINLTQGQVEKILFDITDGNFKSDNLPFILKGKTNCTILKDNERFIISFEDGHKEYIRIDKANHKISVQGEWWYQGVYSLRPSNANTIVTLDIYNIADKFKWVASLMILPEKVKHKTMFEKFILELENKTKE